MKIRNHIALLALGLLLGGLHAADEKRALTNADVVKMVKAGLPESTIVIAIQQSPTAFDMQPDALIELQTSGVPPKILETMLAPKPAAPAAGTTAPAKAASPSEGADGLPTTYGFYIRVDGELSPFPKTMIKHVFGLMVGGSSDRGFAVDGFDSKGNIPVIIARQPEYILFQHGVDPTQFRLALLQDVKSMSVRQFNIINTRTEFFENVYGVSPYRVIDVNLLRPVEQIPLQIEPITGRPDMYRLIPQGHLLPDMKYAFYRAGDLHDTDIVFSASPGQPTALGYLFAAAPKTLEELKEENRGTEGNLAAYRELIAQPVSASTQPTKSYFDKKTGVSVSYPADFTPLKGMPKPVLLGLQSPGRDTQQCKLFVSHDTFGRGPRKTLEKIAGETLDGVKTMMPGANVLGPIETTMAGRRALLYIISGTQRNGTALTVATTTVVDGNQILGAVLNSTPEKFADYWIEYKRLCDSFTAPPAPR